MRKLFSVAIVTGLALLSMAANCGGPGPGPIPTPTPTPTPTPDIHVPVCSNGNVSECWHEPPTGWVYNCKGGSPTVKDPKDCPVIQPGALLKVQGNVFVPPILGSVTTHHGWPLVDKYAQNEIKKAGLNYTAMRLPCEIDARPEYNMFALVNDTQVDLTRFNPGWDQLHSDTIAHAQGLGIFVSQGLWDGWCAIHVKELMSPFKKAHNINGVDIGTCDDFKRAPDPTILRVVAHTVSVVGKYTNIIWELGNEANRCQPTDEFIDGIRNAVRAAEDAGHYPHHLWSPGTIEAGARGSTLDYISKHGGPSQGEATQPVDVNEFAPKTQAEYLRDLAIAPSGVAFQYWHDDNPYPTLRKRGPFRGRKRLNLFKRDSMTVANYRRATRKTAPDPKARGDWDDPAWEAEWIDTMSKMHGAPPATGCFDIPNEDSTAVEPRPPADPQVTDAINAAVRRLKPECAVGSDCPIGMGMQQWFSILTEEIRKGDPANGIAGLCAGVQTDSEGPVDQICVGSTTRCQGNHVYTCNTGCATGKVGWAPGSYSNRNGDTWVRPGTTACQPCPQLGTIQLKNAGVNRVVVDATPKTCIDKGWNSRCSTGASCAPGGTEEDPTQRQACERQWGPYKWTVDGVDCVASGACFLDGGNPLRLVVPGGEGKTIRIDGSNAVHAEIVGSHP